MTACCTGPLIVPNSVYLCDSLASLDSMVQAAVTLAETAQLHALLLVCNSEYAVMPLDTFPDARCEMLLMTDRAYFLV